MPKVKSKPIQVGPTQTVAETIRDLKVNAYDLLAQQQHVARQLEATNQEIARLSQIAPESSPVTPTESNEPA